VIDDVWIYRLDGERYWMVVNAANNDKDWAWINAVREGRVMIDADRPWSRALGTETVMVNDMRDPARGGEMRAQLALQGPSSLEILLAMLDSKPSAMRTTLLEMKRTEIVHGELAGYDLYIARTGYTGEPMGFEIFVHPAAAPALWHLLMEAGTPLGLRPCGLAARDSLRIEAGLPLYGHELAGPLELNPADAGFAPYVKLYKPYFIGKRPFVLHDRRERTARLVRFQLEEERAGILGQGDVIVNRKGRVVGTVTSCSIGSEGRLIGLGYVQEGNYEKDTRLGVYKLSSRTWESSPLESLKPGDRVQLPENITVIARFLNKQ
jgi:glycine hydroxymethyltransferase